MARISVTLIAVIFLGVCSEACPAFVFWCHLLPLFEKKLNDSSLWFLFYITDDFMSHYRILSPSILLWRTIVCLAIPCIEISLMTFDDLCCPSPLFDVKKTKWQCPVWFYLMTWSYFSVLFSIPFLKISNVRCIYLTNTDHWANIYKEFFTKTPESLKLKAHHCIWKIWIIFPPSQYIYLNFYLNTFNLPFLCPVIQHY